MSQKPTVGRIVHFYSDAIADRDPSAPGYGFNGQGRGPYLAVVTQAFDGPYSNLKVFPPFAEAFDEGSVSHFGDLSEENRSRYWIWPPRE